MDSPEVCSPKSANRLKPLKGCLKSPPVAARSSDSDPFASFEQACAEFHASSPPITLPSELDLTIHSPPFFASDSSPFSAASSNYSSGANTPSTSGNLTPRTQARKNVSFCPEEDGLEQVFIADTWDRTPAEPAGHLSYQDILELKAIQNTLPRAQQLPDLYTGKPAHQYLQKVPIGLLPLTDQSSPCSSPIFTPHPSPADSPDFCQGSPNGSAEHSPIHSPPCGLSPKLPPPPPPQQQQQQHGYIPATTSPLAASALAAIFASKHAEKRVYAHNPIPSNLGPKFRPPCNPHHHTPVYSVTESDPIPPSSPAVESPSTPRAPAPAPTPTPNPFSMAHLLPSRSTTPMRRKPNFAFLPLLDAPTSPDTSLSPTANSQSEESRPKSTLIGSYDDEPPSEAYSSSSSSYASDSERDFGSGYTDGSPLSRSTSITSVSTVGSVLSELKESQGAVGSAYTEEPNPGDSGFFFMPPSKHAPYDPGYFGRPGPSSSAIAKDPRLQAIASPSLAPPSPLSLDGSATEVDLARLMHERLGRMEWEHLKNDIPDTLEGVEPVARSRSISTTSSRGHSREGSHEMDLDEIERVRRERLGRKWTPPPSRDASRASSRAPSRERTLLEVNGVEIEVGVGGGDDS
ncbi:hypothetical protein D9757_004696 [Collybiopsis confluens]|uniref:Uncharacterized protein n=1 Tax=Collybiopsis confluens TaxID=2823264 RepID=A0A8H5HSQ8_9AGAR|nr:hypothetical protein D9757_004696 [Collybiopsis confluens]